MNQRQAARLAYLNDKYGPVPDEVPDEAYFARRLAELDGTTLPNLLLGVAAPGGVIAGDYVRGVA